MLLLNIFFRNYQEKKSSLPTTPPDKRKLMFIALLFSEYMLTSMIEKPFYLNIKCARKHANTYSTCVYSHQLSKLAV